ECGFEIVSDALGTLRQEKGTPVEGRILVARRTSDTAIISDALAGLIGFDHSADQTIH
ncbi:MAG TPA: methyltransferase type 11, partial [Thalassospira sp.]|nr:methyltransferase type 11 [Thalassospira sp.]